MLVRTRLSADYESREQKWDRRCQRGTRRKTRDRQTQDFWRFVCKTNERMGFPLGEKKNKCVNIRRTTSAGRRQLKRTNGSTISRVPLHEVRGGVMCCSTPTQESSHRLPERLVGRGMFLASRFNNEQRKIWVGGLAALLWKKNCTYPNRIEDSTKRAAINNKSAGTLATSQLCKGGLQTRRIAGASNAKSRRKFGSLPWRRMPT